jgi:glycine C-acetyltransferase/8-amino-7-oxononanoate synthase
MLELDERIAELDALGLARATRTIEGPQGPHVVVDGRTALLMCSNNYLGLADHPRVRAAAAEAALHWGVGAGASRLVSGTMTVHRELEQQLADFKRRPAGLLFGSGYLANVGVISALAGRGQVVFSDRLNHASIVDGCRLSRAEAFVYRHLDVEHLRWGLERAGDRAAMIVTDSVFSMDGDVAPLPDLVELARRHRVRLVVDEAHATGALGPGGRGAVAAAGLSGDVDVLVGTLGKALGSYGAFVACDESMARFLTNIARTFIFSTAPPIPAVAGAAAALSVLRERPALVDSLQSGTMHLRRALSFEGFDVGVGGTQIVPVIIGDASQTMRVSELALERGVFAQAIRPPTVPNGSSRLRLTVMATHSEQELRQAAQVIGGAARESGVHLPSRGRDLRDAA